MNSLAQLHFLGEVPNCRKQSRYFADPACSLVSISVESHPSAMNWDDDDGVPTLSAMFHNKSSGVRGFIGVERISHLAMPRTEIHQTFFFIQARPAVVAEPRDIFRCRSGLQLKS